MSHQGKHTSAEHWAVALASFSTGLVREVMVAVVYIPLSLHPLLYRQFSPSTSDCLLSTTRDHTHSRAPKNKNKRFRDAERKKERGRELLFADPRYAIAHTVCFVLISPSCFFEGLHTSQSIGNFFGLAMVDFGSRLYDTVAKDAP